jgi:ER-bound oxygenase mpaB/B'/Rubber oxygenase, catalytic domain
VRFGSRVDRLAPFLRKSASLADAAAEAIDQLPKGEGWALVGRIATSGLAKHAGVNGANSSPNAIRNYFEALEDVPAWVDEETLQRGGQLVLRAGILSGMVLAARCIVLGYASPGGNKPLIFAGGLTNRASRRLSETGRYVRSVIVRGGLMPGGEGYIATAKVRLMHAHVRRSLMRDARWNEAAWGVPINQHDMAATTLLFSLVLVEGLETLGLSIEPGERESYMHLWRYAGHLMGVSPELLPTGIEDARRLADLMDATQAPPDDDARTLTRAMLQAGAHEAVSRTDKRRAERGVHLVRAAAPLLLGPERAAQLGFEPTPMRWAMPLLRRLVTGTELLARARPIGLAQLRAGSRYWDEIRDRGFAIYGTPFQLPEMKSAGAST